MGLLDQVIGQVVGQLAKGASAGQPAGRGAPAPSGGGLGDLLGGSAGKYSPLVLALLALLASKHLGSGAGGYGTVLHDIFGKLAGGASGAAPHDPRGPAGQAEEDGEEVGPDDGNAGQDDDGRGGPFAGPARGGTSSSGGFLNEVGSMLDGPGGGRSPSSAGAGPVGNGLDGLLERFRQHGQGGVFDSWLGHGSNQPISPGSLGDVLGQDTVDQLARGTGLNRDDLLSQLSQALPQVVDKLSPAGRMPTADEHRSWI